LAGNGKRRYLSRNVSGGRKEAERALRELLRLKDHRALANSARQTVEAFLAQWLDVAVRPKVRGVTLQFYTKIAAYYVTPELGATRLDKLQLVAVQRWVNGLHDRSLSPRTVRAAYAVLHGALRQAVRWGMLATDPSALVELPRARRTHEVAVLTPEEVKTFLAACSGHPLGAFFVLGVASACRPGELAALQWEDVDFDKGALHVRHALTRFKDADGTVKVEFNAPKTDRGRRVIPLPPFGVAALREHRARQLEARLRSGGEWPHPELVFTDAAGGPLDLGRVRECSLKAVLRAAGLPESFTLYSLRHTAASLLLAAGVHVKAVSERLGHVSTAFTMDTYVHSLPTVQEEAAAALERMVTGA
jgi:integrase